MSEKIREPLMSGHCSFPQTKDPEVSHRRCGGGQRANPEREFQPCPCGCHLGEDRYECENCGGTLAEAPIISEVAGEDVFVHVDPQTGRSIGEYCRA